MSKTRCFERYCSCDKTCQFLTLQGKPSRSYLETLTIDYKFMNKRIRLFIHQTMCLKRAEKEKILVHHNNVAKWQTRIDGFQRSVHRRKDGTSLTFLGFLRKSKNQLNTSLAKWLFNSVAISGYLKCLFSSWNYNANRNST